MTDDKLPQDTPDAGGETSGSRWEPDPAAPAGEVAAAPVPPADPAFDPAYGAQPAAAPASRRPTRTQALTGGLAAAALVIVGGLGFAVGHAAAGDGHGRDGFSDVSFQNGDHGLPPGTQNGVPAPGQPGFGDDGDDDGGLFGDSDDDDTEGESNS